jgi:hypothetical protein
MTQIIELPLYAGGRGQRHVVASTRLSNLDDPTRGYYGATTLRLIDEYGVTLGIRIVMRKDGSLRKYARGAVAAGRSPTGKDQSFLLHNLMVGTWDIPTGRRTSSFETLHDPDPDGLNNTVDNIRLGSKQENQLSTRKRPGTMQYRGVSRCHDRFQATVTKDGEKHHLGTFDTEEEAARVYDAAKLRLFPATPATGLNFQGDEP